MIDKRTLKSLYIDKNMTTREIGELYERPKSTILNWLKKYDIPRRRFGRREGTGSNGWKGGKRNNRGYIQIWVGGKYIDEHRKVMEEYLGRKLLPFPQEIVHHRNGIRSDNRIENLEVMSASEHMRRHSSGEKNGFAKVSDLDVEEMHRKRALGMRVKDIAEEYQISSDHTSAILNRRARRSLCRVRVVRKCRTGRKAGAEVEGRSNA